MFDRGGNAVDAAIAANAAIAVTAPHLCGMGGDLFALVRTRRRRGRRPQRQRPRRPWRGRRSDARRGAHRDADAPRHPRGHRARAASTGGSRCTNASASLDLATILAPAIRLAASGFPASPLLVASLGMLDDDARPRFEELVAQATSAGRAGAPARSGADAAGHRRRRSRSVLRRGVRRGAARTWVPVTSPRPTSLRAQADWVDPLVAPAFGVELLTIGPNSQGYLLLGAARLGGTGRRARQPRRRRLGARARRGCGDGRLRPPRGAPRLGRRGDAARGDRGAGRAASTRSKPAAGPSPPHPATRRTCARPTQAGWPSA